MLDERELIVRPIVPESVQHNARVSENICSAHPSLLTQHVFYPVYTPLLTTLLSTTDRLQHPRPDSFTLRRRRRHSGSGILVGLYLLLSRHGAGLGVDFRAQGRAEHISVLFPTSGRSLGWRSLRRPYVVRAHVDVVLRAVQGVRQSLCYLASQHHGSAIRLPPWCNQGDADLLMVGHGFVLLSMLRTSCG